MAAEATTLDKFAMNLRVAGNIDGQTISMEFFSAVRGFFDMITRMIRHHLEDVPSSVMTWKESSYPDFRGSILFGMRDSTARNEVEMMDKDPGLFVRTALDIASNVVSGFPMPRPRIIRIMHMMFSDPRSDNYLPSVVEKKFYTSADLKNYPRVKLVLHFILYAFLLFETLGSRWTNLADARYRDNPYFPVHPRTFRDPDALYQFLERDYYPRDKAEESIVVSALFRSEEPEHRDPDTVKSIRLLGGAAEWQYRDDDLFYRGLMLSGAKIYHGGKDDRVSFISIYDRRGYYYAQSTLVVSNNSELHPMLMCIKAGFHPKMVTEKIFFPASETKIPLSLFTFPASRINIWYSFGPRYRLPDDIQEKIVKLVVAFEKANFVHHNLHFSKLVFHGKGPLERLYISDTSCMWWGGFNYPKDSGNERNYNDYIPYGYDYDADKVVFPQPRYLPTRLFAADGPKGFSVAPKCYDFLSLVAEMANSGTPPDIIKSFMQKYEKESGFSLNDYLTVTHDGRLVYINAREESKTRVILTVHAMDRNYAPLFSPYFK